MPDLEYYVWMRQQWRRFRHVLVGTHTAVLILCASGLLLLHDEEDPQTRIYVQLALIVLLVASTVVAMWLLYRARHEICDLGQLSAGARLEAAHTRQEKDKKKGRHRG
ncbi:MAG: hypothetical protein VYD18_08430 [Candidatus Latescibacterota bacterium]|nr:hypothetical protein [Candidatus Latescibacterota bacterium]